MAFETARPRRGPTGPTGTTAIERLLPFAAIAETILTKGKSPGGTSLQILDRLERERELERERGETAIDRRLKRELLKAQTEQIKRPTAKTEGQIKREAQEKTNLSLREQRKNRELGLGDLTPEEETLFDINPQQFLEQNREQKLSIAKQSARDLADARLKGLNVELKEAQLNKIQEDLNRLNKAEVVRAKKEQIGLAKDLSKELVTTGITDAITLTNQITDELKIDNPDFDIPGFGLTGFLADRALSKEGKSARQLIQKFTNITLKDRSGAAVTVPEFDRFVIELGGGAFRTDAQLRQGLLTARNALIEKIKTVEAPFLIGLDESTLSELKKFGVKLSEDVQVGVKEDKFNKILDKLETPTQSTGIPFR